MWSLLRNLMKHKNKTMELAGVLISDFIVLRGAAVSSEFDSSSVFCECRLCL